MQGLRQGSLCEGRCGAILGTIPSASYPALPLSLAITTTWASTLCPHNIPLGIFPLALYCCPTLPQTPGGAREDKCGGNREGFFWLVPVP